MAYIVGYVSKAERRELERRGWEVEDAKRYDLVGDSHHLLAGAENGDECVVIFVDSSVFNVMSGPDWEKGEQLYWSNEDGWGDFSSATVFSEHEKATLDLPIGGRWERSTDGWIIAEEKS